MFDIVPNWHPAAVHFPLALGITATLLLALSCLRSSAFLAASARLLLQFAAISAILAAALGWHAFTSVEHDAAGHAVMLRHRDWAMLCTLGLVGVAALETWRQHGGLTVHRATLGILVFLSGGLAYTGWLGAEMVYRHGIGVDPAAFAPLPNPPATATQSPLPAIEAAAPTEHIEHVHKDGKRHRH